RSSVRKIKKLPSKFLVPQAATHRSVSWPENHISLWLATWRVTQNCGLPHRVTRLRTSRLLKPQERETNSPVNGLMTKRCGSGPPYGVMLPKTWQRRIPLVSDSATFSATSRHTEARTHNVSSTTQSSDTWIRVIGRASIVKVATARPHW